MSSSVIFCVCFWNIFVFSSSPFCTLSLSVSLSLSLSFSLRFLCLSLSLHLLISLSLLFSLPVLLPHPGPHLFTPSFSPSSTYTPSPPSHSPPPSSRPLFFRYLCLQLLRYQSSLIIPSFTIRVFYYPVCVFIFLCLAFYAYCM